MKQIFTINIIVLLLLFICLASCAQIITNNDDWVSFHNPVTNEYGYKNSKGDIVIALGKYERCFTDTLKTYTIVVKPTIGFVAIDRQENVLYEVFPFDNGSDNPANGLFRIIENCKIGYADFTTGKIKIKPQFDCAWPFENGLAEVSNDCTTQLDGKHSVW